jgi:hypothetical protein
LATNLGAKALAALGALAFVVFLGLFVRYAWENDWVGPKGRVLLGALAGAGLVGAGVRLVRARYRPLGQGLAGAGFASLYVSAYGAHGFYQLMPRGAAFLLMVAVTASAVLLAARLDARLLASLAWVGGYLTPVLLTTGQDQAVSLFLYLALLTLGALALDHVRPWPETAPLAMAGNWLLYLGWYAQHFRPERLGVAAAGVALFTGLPALGMARKARPGALAAAVALGALAASLLVSGGRGEVVLGLSLALAGTALLASPPAPVLRLAAAAALAVPFLAWSASGHGPGDFGVRAAWALSAALLFFWRSPRDDAKTDPWLAAALVAGGIVAVALAGEADRPRALGALFVAQAGLAILARPRWRFSLAAAVALTGLAVAGWWEAFYRPGRGLEACALALPFYAVVLSALAAPSLLAGSPLGRAGLPAHLLNAGLAWTVLYHVFHDARPRLLGLMALALSAAYLLLGLALARTRETDALHVRAALGLAATFLTLAIPVQLGLHGITLAWAAEGLLLAWLGARFDSVLTRAGGHLVVALALGRLLFWHTPLHRGAFTPVLNPSFGTWVAVIAVAFVAASLGRGARRTWDRWARPLLTAAALGLLFLAFSVETHDAFLQAGRRAGTGPALMAARRAAGVALSVLWTLFATGLLAAGIALRVRGLLYGAYGLFALTALKVVLVDLSTLPTPYRMLSFLGLAVLALAAAFLILRFRERLLSGAGP